MLEGRGTRKNQTMKRLETYQKNGHSFSLHERTGDLATFHGNRIGGSSETWEVIHIQSHNGREIAGKYFDPAEFPPSNEQWGSKGFTCRNLEAANIRLSIEKEKVKGQTSD